MYRELAIRQGEWNDARETAYQLLKSGDTLTPEQEVIANKLVMQPLKYIHYGFSVDGLRTPIYDKMALMPLYKGITKGKDIDAIYDFMQNSNVHMVKMDTAVKSGNIPAQ